MNGERSQKWVFQGDLNNNHEMEMETTSKSTDTASTASDVTLTDIVNTRSATENQLADLESQLKAVKDELRDQLFTERKMLLNQINKIVPQIEALKEDEQKDQQSVADLQGDVEDETTVQFANTKRQKQRAQEQLTNVEQQQADVAKSIAEYEKQADGAKEELAGYEQEEADMVEKIKQETDLATMISLAEQQKSHVQVLNAKKDDIKRQIEVVEVKLNNAQTRQAELPKEVDNIKSKQNVLDEQLDKLQKEIDAKQADREKARQAAERRLTSTQSALDNAQNRHQQYTTQLENTKKKLEHYFQVTESVNEVVLDQEARYFVFERNLERTPSAEQKAALQATAATFKQAQVAPTYITVDYNDYLQTTWHDYQQQGLLAPNAQLLNLYQSLQDSDQPQAAADNIIPQNDDWQYTKDEATHSELVRDQNNQPVMQLKRRDDDTLWYVLYYSQGKVIKRDVFDLEGQLSATQYLDQNNANRVVSENFYRTNGSLVLVKEYNENEKETIQLLNEAGVLLEVFSTENELIIWWLKNMVFTNNHSQLLINTASDFYDYLVENKPEQVDLLPVIADLEQQSTLANNILTGKAGVRNLFLLQQSDYEKVIETSQISLNASVLGSK
ncbi:hypothetical protein Lcor42L_12085 [Loigolactobacillus coryniformis subsp. torquens]|nr:hypothetical protein [Loigolactobacillus coryniformis subsp. torquens]MBW4806152.1 hypothetical protein [Loigolactobacillus coryniformis subsp. torquens]